MGRTGEAEAAPLVTVDVAEAADHGKAGSHWSACAASAS